MRLIVEIEGARLEVLPEDVVNPHLSVVAEVVEVPCDCPDGPCRSVHRKHTGAWRVEVSADLRVQPLWEVAG